MFVSLKDLDIRIHCRILPLNHLNQENSCRPKTGKVLKIGASQNHTSINKDESKSTFLTDNVLLVEI